MLVYNIYNNNTESLLICRTFFTLSPNVCCIQNTGINYKANFGLVVDLTPDENVIPQSNINKFAGELF